MVAKGDSRGASNPSEGGEDLLTLAESAMISVDFSRLGADFFFLQPCPEDDDVEVRPGMIPVEREWGPVSRSPGFKNPPSLEADGSGGGFRNPCFQSLFRFSMSPSCLLYSYPLLLPSMCPSLLSPSPLPPSLLSPSPLPPSLLSLPPSLLSLPPSLLSLPISLSLLSPSPLSLSSDLSLLLSHVFSRLRSNSSTTRLSESSSSRLPREYKYSLFPRPFGGASGSSGSIPAALKSE